MQKSDLLVEVHADSLTTKYDMSEIEKAIRRIGISREYIWE